MNQKEMFYLVCCMAGAFVSGWVLACALVWYDDHVYLPSLGKDLDSGDYTYLPQLNKK